MINLSRFARQKRAIIAYTNFANLGKEKLNGAVDWRKRVSGGAQTALTQSMQDWLEEMVQNSSRTFNETTGVLRIELPAEGRIGYSNRLDMPRYRYGYPDTLELEVRRGVWEAIDAPMMTTHEIQLYQDDFGNWVGEAPFFGDLIEETFIYFRS